NRVRTSVTTELPDPWPEQERAGECGEGALVMNHRGAGKILNALAEQTAACVPDPVRRHRVDEREDHAEGRVDPELRPLGHRAPDDGERDAREDDLEEIAAGGRDAGEERIRGLADRGQHSARGAQAD